MTRVFIVNEPLKRDDISGEYLRFLPLESAANFGRVIKLTPDGGPGGNPAAWMKLIRETLERDWEDGDFLVLVGDQAMLAYAASVVGGIVADTMWEADAYGGDIPPEPVIRFLKWERRQNTYVPLTLREAHESV